MTVESWKPGFLPAVVRFWNRSFATKRNFVPLTASAFRSRVLRHPEFDPHGLLLAFRRGEVIGMAHVGRERRKPGRGYLAFLWVDAGFRRKGIGTTLWHHGLDLVRGVPIVAVLNGWENPFYGARKGAIPFWGGPWGIGVEWGDSKSLKFFARKGHPPQTRAVHLALELGPAAPTGVRLRTSRRGAMRVCAGSAGAARGTLGYFGFQKSRPRVWGLYGISGLDPARRPESRLAKALIRAALSDIGSRGGQSCEVLSYPDLRPEEHELYVKAGFVPVGSWAIF